MGFAGLTAHGRRGARSEAPDGALERDGVARQDGVGRGERIEGERLATRTVLGREAPD